MLAQLAGDVLGVPPEDIDVIAGDTAGTALGFGAFASRQTVTAGNAVHLAAIAVRDKAIKAAAEMLEASAEDLELKDGAVQVKGVPQMRKTLAQIAHAIGGVPGFALPNGVTPGLAASIDFPAPALTYCNGTHVCEAEVDPETGMVRLIRYIVVHDCGRIINPMIVDGQVWARSRTASARRSTNGCASTNRASRRPSPTAIICCRAPTPCRRSR